MYYHYAKAREFSTGTAGLAVLPKFELPAISILAGGDANRQQLRMFNPSAMVGKPAQVNVSRMPGILSGQYETDPLVTQEQYQQAASF